MTELLQQAQRFLSPWTDASSEILGVHLHRYLMPLLIDHKIPKLWVMIGFEASHMPAICLSINAHGAVVDSIGDEYESLAAEARKNANLDTVIVRNSLDKTLSFYPVLSISEPGREHIHAFVVSEDAKIFEADILTHALRTRINEAIRAYRHNSLRIAFDECEGLGPKEFLDRILELIPIWCGADHSASLILSSSLESMVMSHVGPAHFQIVSEKFYVQAEDENRSYDNLSGLEFVVNHQNSGLIGHAYEEVRRTKSVGLNIFIGDVDTQEWFSMGEVQSEARRLSTHAYRPREKLTVLLPLLCENEIGDSELLGFLSINFTETMPLASLTSRVLETLAVRLGTYLHRSSFFSLSAQQLWLLECVREEQVSLQRLFRNAKTGGFDGVHAVESFARNVSKLLANSTKIPCVGIGFRTQDESGEDILRFVGPQGSTYFDDIDLPVFSDDVAHSSLSTLAVRLNRPITLTGGSLHDGATTFDCSIYVNEKLGTMRDKRMESELDADWRPLSDYYKATREGSYAAISYPIRMRDDVIGVIAVEVDRDTNWIWWTGFGSYLFYRLLANELAADFNLLGLELPEN